MGLFAKKEKQDFETTEVISVFGIRYDEHRKLLQVKNGFQVNTFSIHDIDDIVVRCGQKEVSKKNLGGALAGAAVFGPAGIFLAGSHKVDYISNLRVNFVLKDGRLVILVVVIGKTKNRGQLELVENAVARIEELMKEEEQI